MGYVSDLVDVHGDVQICGGVFHHFGGTTSFSGPATTVHVAGDNVLVKQALTEAEPGTVVVVDGEADLSCALLGDQLAEIGVRAGVTGVVVNGCVRDSLELARLPIGVLALGTNPRKSGKTGAGNRGSAVTFAGVTWQPGHWVYADADGIVVSAEPLRPEVGGS